MLQVIEFYDKIYLYRFYCGVIFMNRIEMSSDGFSDDQIIELRKIINDQIKDARKKSRHNKCLLCDKEGGFCDSHIIPQFCLKNIAWNGKLNSFNTLIDSNFLKKDSGIKDAGIFHLICKSCDGRVFQNYENSDAYETIPTVTALNQIVLKTSLRDIYKHESEIEMYKAMKKVMKEKSPFLSIFINKMLDSQIAARKWDTRECYEIFNTAKENLESSENWLRIISYDKLDYTVPIAFQGMIALVTGVNGETINDNYNYDSSYKVEYLHIAVFPLKQSTAVILFLDNKCSRYENFEKFLSNSTREKRLEIINRIIFLYAEDYYLSKLLDDEIIRTLQEPAKILQDTFTTNPRKSLKNSVKDYDLRRDFCIPNLLSRDYSVKFED